MSANTKYWRRVRVSQGWELHVRIPAFLGRRLMRQDHEAGRSYLERVAVTGS